MLTLLLGAPPVEWSVELVRVQRLLQRIESLAVATEGFGGAQEASV